jgi:pyridoxamine 5'-phosphate oxidase
MNKKEMYEFITANPMGYMATVDGNKPHVRGMETYRADENGLIFYTNKSKDVGKQIAANPEVEVCYFANGIQLRVSGRMEMAEDLGLKKEIVEARPFLKPAVEQAGNYDQMLVCRLKPVKASTWSMQNLMDDKVPVDL